MTIPAAFRARLLANPIVSANIGDRFYESSAIGVDPIPAQPEFVWASWKEMPSTSIQVGRKTGSTAKNRIFLIYVYDHMGTYGRINEVLEAMEVEFVAMAPFKTTDGYQCHDLWWGGLSGNLTDDGYRSSVRFGTVRMTTNR